MFIILKDFRVSKHRQTMAAPTGSGIVLAPTRHFDDAALEPLGHNPDDFSAFVTQHCSIFISECDRNRILLKFMRSQHHEQRPRRFNRLAANRLVRRCTVRPKTAPTVTIFVVLPSPTDNRPPLYCRRRLNQSAAAGTAALV